MPSTLMASPQPSTSLWRVVRSLPQSKIPRREWVLLRVTCEIMWVYHKVLWDLVSMDIIDQRWSKWPQCHNRIVNYVCREMYGDTCEVISSGMASLMHSLGPVVLRSGSCFKTPATSSRHSNRWMSVKKSPDRLQRTIETKGSWDCWQVEALL